MLEDTLNIRWSEVPPYLHASDFYKSLSKEDDNEEISVLRSHTKLDSTVEMDSDLVHILASARFWGLDAVPDEALHYAMFVADENTFNQIEEFEDPFGTVRSLKAIRFSDGVQKIIVAAACGRIDFIRYLLAHNHVLSYSAGVKAAENGHLACLEHITNVLLAKSNKPYKQVKLREVVADMNLDCWKHLHDHGASLAGCSATKAAGSGNLTCLRFIHETNGNVDKHALIAAISHGHMACAAYIYEQMGVALDSDHGAAAAARGDLACLQFLFERGCPPAMRISNAAAHYGDVECLKYVHQRGCQMTKTTMMHTVSLDCIKYMREQGVRWDNDLYIWALQESRVDCQQYFHEKELTFHSLPTLKAACNESGESLRFLYEHGAEVPPGLMREEVLAGDLINCLKVAVEFGYQPSEGDCAAAAEHGAMRCLQYLHEIHCPWDATACTRAVQRRRLPVLQYLLDNGCPCDVNTFEAAAAEASVIFVYLDADLEEANLDCLQLLLKVGCPWDARVPAAALAHSEAWTDNSQEVLQFLHENGCPWDERTTTNAAINDRRGLDYALSNGCPCRADIIVHVLQNANPFHYIYYTVKRLHEQGGVPLDEQLCTVAAREGNLSVLKYAHEHGCALTAEACTSAVTGTHHSHHTVQQLACLQYLHENGCSISLDTANAAARACNLQCLTYLIQQGCPCDATTMIAAVGACNTDCLQFLHESGCPWDHHVYQASLAEDRSRDFRDYLELHGCPRTAEETAALQAQKNAATAGASAREGSIGQHGAERAHSGGEGSPPTKKQKQKVIEVVG